MRNACEMQETNPKTNLLKLWWISSKSVQTWTAFSSCLAKSGVKELGGATSTPSRSSTSSPPSSSSCWGSSWLLPTSSTRGSRRSWRRRPTLTSGAHSFFPRVRILCKTLNFAFYRRFSGIFSLLTSTIFCIGALKVLVFVFFFFLTFLVLLVYIYVCTCRRPPWIVVEEILWWLKAFSSLACPHHHRLHHQRLLCLFRHLIPATTDLAVVQRFLSQNNERWKTLNSKTSKGGVSSLLSCFYLWLWLRHWRQVWFRKREDSCIFPNLP